MNLKESFRYQNFLDRMMRDACYSVQNSDHAFTITKVHNKTKANPDATDLSEVVEVDDFAPNDDVIRFMAWLIAEREKLTKAISAAKVAVGFDIDAAVETNKFRQQANQAVKRMLAQRAIKRTERGQDYKFNAEGNQMPYYYEIEVTSTEAYDKAKSKDFMRSVIAEADKASADIDSAMINSTVDYEPRFDVNESFEDVMAEFIKSEIAE